MTEFDLNTLTDAYLRRGDENFWAWEEVTRATETDLNEGWEITKLLLAKAESDDDLEHIAAGPLENLIDMHGHKALDLIEEECKSNPKLQRALNTVGVLFYYEEFDRWYSLLCRYGFRQVPSGDSRAAIEKTMFLMTSYLNETIHAGQYDRSMNELLDTPLEDKKAQRILQGACWDVERLDRNTSTPIEHRLPYKLWEPELRTQVRQSLAELESLGYSARE